VDESSALLTQRHPNDPSVIIIQLASICFISIIFTSVGLGVVVVVVVDVIVCCLMSLLAMLCPKPNGFDVMMIDGKGRPRASRRYVDGPSYSASYFPRWVPLIKKYSNQFICTDEIAAIFTGREWFTLMVTGTVATSTMWMTSNSAVANLTAFILIWKPRAKESHTDFYQSSTRSQFLGSADSQFIDGFTQLSIMKFITKNVIYNLKNVLKKSFNHLFHYLSIFFIWKL